MDSSSPIQVSVADYSYLAIQKQYVKMLSYEADVFEDRDPEALHQMRVSIRRLRTAIDVFSSIVDLPDGIGDRSLAKIGKILGNVRDLDVLNIACEQYKSRLPSEEQVYLDRLLDMLIKRRQKGMQKIEVMRDSKNYDRLKSSLNIWLNEPLYTATGKVPLLALLPDLILPAVGKLFQHPVWWMMPEVDRSEESIEDLIEAFILEGGDILHDLRKKIKYNRYLMELFIDFYKDDRYRDFLQDFKQGQKLLGSIQDTLVFEGLIDRMLGKHILAQMPILKKQLTQQRSSAYQTWQPIQHRYQQSSTKQDLRLLIINNLDRI